MWLDKPKLIFEYLNNDQSFTLAMIRQIVGNRYKHSLGSLGVDKYFRDGDIRDVDQLVEKK